MKLPPMPFRSHFDGLPAIRPSENVLKEDFVGFLQSPLRKKLIKLPTLASFRNDPLAALQNERPRGSIKSQPGRGNRVLDPRN